MNEARRRELRINSKVLDVKQGQDDRKLENKIVYLKDVKAITKLPEEK